MENYHLVKDGDQYKLKKEWTQRASIVFDWNKQEALKQSTEFMKNHGGSLKIHKNDWKIQEERTYPKSADPSISKG